MIHGCSGQETAPSANYKGFAKRLRIDYNAVHAGMTLSWSNGQTEGQVNRLKTLKRQMYGRANLDLLGRRFLLAS